MLEYRRLKNKYNYYGTKKSPEGYLKDLCSIAKYIDQSVSTNTTVIRQHFYTDEKIPMSEFA